MIHSEMEDDYKVNMSQALKWIFYYVLWLKADVSSVLYYWYFSHNSDWMLSDMYSFSTNHMTSLEVQVTELKDIHCVLLCLCFSTLECGASALSARLPSLDGFIFVEVTESTFSLLWKFTWNLCLAFTLCQPLWLQENQSSPLGSLNVLLHGGNGGRSSCLGC